MYPILYSLPSLEINTSILKVEHNGEFAKFAVNDFVLASSFTTKK